MVLREANVRFNSAMSRNEYTPDHLDAIAGDLSEAAEALKSAARLMRSESMPHALLHGATVENLHIPTIIEWVGKTTLDVKTQLRAFLAGIQSKAALNKQYNDAQKAAAAKKPWPKKPPAKKST